MTLQQLKYFLTMAEVLHYTQAAKMLYISQSSLSYSISELEKELGAPLFDKQGKKTVLTKYGGEFLPYAREALRNIEEGALRVEKLLSQPSDIKLGYIYSLSFDFLPHALSGFRGLPGNANATFSFFQGLSTAILEKLRHGELELALSVEPGDSAIESVPVYEQQLYVVVYEGHRLTGLPQVTIDDLKDESFITINKGSGLRSYLDGIFETLKATPRITFEAEECNAMASFISAKFGIAIMPEIPALGAYNVKVLPVADKHLSRQIHLLWVKSRPLSAAAERFREYILRQAGASLPQKQ